MRRLWSADDDKRLASMWADRTPFTLICRRLERNDSSVSQRIRHLKPPPREAPPMLRSLALKRRQRQRGLRRQQSTVSWLLETDHQ